MKTYKVLISMLASERLVEIHENISKFYSDKKADVVLDLLLGRIDTLQTFPNRNPILQGDFGEKEFRKIFQGTFTIVYEVEEERMRILVLTVFDGRRSPDWLEKDLPKP